jgi:hypothetical protein
MSVFKINSILVIKDVEQKQKNVDRVHTTRNQTYKETITGTVTAPKEIFGRVEKILERDGINRRETEYVVEIYRPDETGTTRNYAESYLIRYARLLT